MFLFLLPLLVGFAFNCASAFTTFFSTRLGERSGRLLCIVLRDVVGIPLWAIGYGMAALAASPQFFTPTLLTSALAWLLIIFGSAVIIAGMVSLRWKAAAPSLKDSLVTDGLYAHIRHPFYTGMFAQLLGLALWFPTQSMSLACLIGMLWIGLQARLEELDLLQRLPAYKEYMQRVPRFLPRF